MPQPRSRPKKNWPTGLYDSKVRGVTYYRFRHPDTGKFHGLGRDFDMARETAIQMNAKLAAAPVARAVARIEGGSAMTFHDACDVFLGVVRTRKTGRGEDTKERSEKTLSDYEGYLRRFKAYFGAKFGGDVALVRLDLQAVSDFLDTYVDKLRARQYARGLLVQIWDVAKAKGCRVENWPEQTLDLKPTVKRDRLTLEQFEAIVDGSDPWFKAAAEFALYCDQRRNEVATVPASAWDGEVLSFVQEKTDHVVNVTAGPKLLAAIEACQAIQLPKSVRATTLIRHPVEGRVSPDMLTRAFQEKRDELIRKGHKAWRKYRGDHMKSRRPTWHEVRSLGAHLAERAKKDSQALAGHATKQMHDSYQRGHAKVFEAESL